jgi:hypothetical protein
MHNAIFGDVHGNKHALDAVVQDVAARQPDHLYCLRDLVGYGAFPLRRARSRRGGCHVRAGRAGTVPSTASLTGLIRRT